MPDTNDGFIGRHVIVRTYSAGVHFGLLVKRDGKECVLNDARRIWEWRGAFTLSAVAMEGIKSGRISAVVPLILLTEAIEIIPCSTVAIDNISGMAAHKP